MKGGEQGWNGKTQKREEMDPYWTTGVDNEGYTYYINSLMGYSTYDFPAKGQPLPGQFKINDNVKYIGSDIDTGNTNIDTGQTGVVMGMGIPTDDNEKRILVQFLYHDGDREDTDNVSMAPDNLRRSA